MIDDVFRLPDRAALSLTGRDAEALLERTITCTVAGLAVGEARPGALLTPQGKIIADFILVRTGEGFLIDTHVDAAPDLAKRLKMLRLRADVAISALNDGISVSIAPAGTEGAVADPRSPDLPWRLIGPREAPRDPGAYAAARFAAGGHEWGADYGAAEVFPADVNLDLMGGVDFKKGCFIGQEVVSRMKRRGGARKRTVGVAGDDLATGETITADGAGVGEVTSARGGSGLARIRIDRLVKAEAAGAAILVNEKQVTFEKPDWLQSEIAALSGDG